jgi:catechol 2,3-dioxygenase
MSTETIPGTTTLGAVHLVVRDLERSLTYYEQGLGLVPREREGAIARLGTASHELLVLHGDPDAPRARGACGLFHFAVLVPTRADLARQLHHLIEARVRIDGASDHRVSEALYLTDPEGNGIEIYRDRPRAEWPHDRGGGLHMTTDPLDVNGLLAEANGTSPHWSGMPAGTRIGHVHLKVADIEDSAHFYVDVLGFELMQRYGRDAAFVSAGGYHHHVAFNTWSGAGAPPAPPGAAGLDRFELVLPGADALARVIARVRDAGAPLVLTESGAEVADPSGIRARLVAAAS